MAFPKMIFDRTVADLSENNEKAYHQVSDLLRINQACTYINNVFKGIGMDSVISINGSWGDFDYTTYYIERILQNIKTLRDPFELPPLTPEVPESFNKPTLEKANDIEQILHDIAMLGDFILTANAYVLATKDGKIFLYKTIKEG